MAEDHSVLGRLMLIVDACLVDEAAVSLAELTVRTGLPKPTARRLAEQLVHHGLLQRTESGYLSGPHLAMAGERAAQQQRHRESLAPFLADLHARTGAAVWIVDISDPDGSWPIVATVYGQRAARSGHVDDWPRHPLDPRILATCLGRLGLARHPERVHDLLRAGMTRLTPYTDVSPARVLRAVESAGANEEALEHEGVARGWSCLTVRIPGGSVTSDALLGIVSPTITFRPARLFAAAHASAGEIGSLL